MGLFGPGKADASTNQTYGNAGKAAAKVGSKQAAQAARSACRSNIVAVTVPPRPGRVARGRSI
jgi:hypothetical protein